jgi:hypothetical protein
LSEPQEMRYGVASLNAPYTPRDVQSLDDELTSPYPDQKFSMLESSKSAQMIDHAQMKFEMNVINSKPETWKGQERWQGRFNEEARVVNMLHAFDFMEKLEDVGVSAKVEWSPGARLWLNDRGRVGRIGITARYWSREKREFCQEVVTSLHYPGPSPEYSVMRFSRYNVPTREKYRGWRTALLVLIHLEIVTERQAELAFGPATGPASEFYLQQLYEFRQEHMGVKQ